MRKNIAVYLVQLNRSICLCQWSKEASYADACPDPGIWALCKEESEGKGMCPGVAHVGHFSDCPGALRGALLRDFWDRWARSGRLFRSPPDAGTTEGTRSPPACRSHAQIPFPRGPRPCLGKDLFIRVSLPLGVVARKPGTL